VLLVRWAADFAEVRSTACASPTMAGISCLSSAIRSLALSARVASRSAISSLTDRFPRPHVLARAKTTGLIAAAGNEERRTTHQSDVANLRDGLLVEGSAVLHRERDLDPGRVSG
jgi:hypothetical protein